METIQLLLILSTFLCSLVAGFLFSFAVIVFPGLKQLDDKEFIRSFQVMDGVIQNNQPLFIIVWAGSVLAIVVAGVLSIWQIDGLERFLILCATFFYLAGVQLPTIAINLPLNNRLQLLKVEKSDQKNIQVERQNFEPRWTRWNTIRTVFACFTSLLLIVLLLRI